MAQTKTNNGSKLVPQITADEPRKIEIDIPKRTKELIMSELKLAQMDIESYVQKRNSDANRYASYILQGVLTTIVGIPDGVQLTPNADYTKLIEK